jgi:hypothetical protein
MLTNRTKQTAQRGTSPRTIWSLVAGMPGTVLSAYCLSSIPTNLSFDGSVRLGHRAAETSAISDRRQLQL